MSPSTTTALRRTLPAILLAAIPAAAAPDLPLEPCHVRGISRQVLCGSLEVPENRDAPQADGRRLSLDTVLVPATSPRDEAEPIYVLAGGPGQAATAIVPSVAGPFADLNRHHDLVFVDQRGSAEEDPLRCDEGDEEEGDAAGGLEAQFLEPDVEEELASCLEDLQADPRFYTTPTAMDDLDDARAALGHDRIHLWGGSYGTRAALVYLDRHGEHAVTAVLDGAAPVQMAIPAPMAVDAERALQRLLEDCTAEPECARAFPELADRIATIRERLAARLYEEPEARIEVRDPLTGEPTRIHLTPESFPTYLRAVLYDVSASRLLPLVLEEAEKGNFEPFVALAWQNPTDGGASISLGLFLSVICAEDKRLIDPTRAREEAAETFLGPSLVESLERACGIWPTGEVPDDYFDPIESDVPVLVLSGELDPVTPPRWGEEVVRGLTRGRHVVVPATGHGTLTSGCVADLVTGFVESDGESVPDTGCLQRLERPRFFVDRLGADPPPPPPDDTAGRSEASR